MKRITRNITILTALILINFVPWMSYGQPVDNTLQNKNDYISVVQKKTGEEWFTLRLLVNNEDIDSLTVLNQQQASKRFGPAKVPSPVVIFHLKASAKVLEKDQLLRKFNIDQAYWKFPLLVDGETISEADHLIAINDAVHTIYVDKNQRHIVVISSFYFNEQRKPKDTKKKLFIR